MTDGLLSWGLVWTLVCLLSALPSQSSSWVGGEAEMTQRGQSREMGGDQRDGNLGAPDWGYRGLSGRETLSLV